MSKIYNFDDSVIIGDRGEADFLRNKTGWKKLPYNGKNSDAHYKDFIHTSGKTLEQKTENYTSTGTGNNYCEMFSDTNRSVIGGPFRAVIRSTDYFMHYYIKDHVIFYYPTDKYVKRILELYEAKTVYDILEGFRKGKNYKYKLYNIHNRPEDGRPDYWTLGAPIKRYEFADILIKQETWTDVI